MSARTQLTFEDEDPLLALERSWETVLRRLDSEVQPHWMERFIRPLKPVSWDGKSVVIEVPGRFVHDWVRERYLGTIQGMLSDELGAKVEVELRSEARSRRTAPQPIADAVAAGVLKAARINVVDDGVTPPLRADGGLRWRFALPNRASKRRTQHRGPYGGAAPGRSAVPCRSHA